VTGPKIAARLLALLQQIRRHGSVSLGRLVRLGADEQEIRALVDTGLVAPVGHGLALTDEGERYSFEEEPTLGDLLDEYERDLQREPERPCHVSDLELPEAHPTPEPAPERRWSDR
jgi:hypothetical protein